MPGFRAAAVGALVFIGFVVGAFVASRSARGGSPRQFWISLFLVYSLGISAAVGFTRRQLFPFHHWPLFEIVLPDTLYSGKLVAVDSTGAEHEIDFRAWQPMNADDVASWAHTRTGFFALDSVERARAAQYLIRHVEAARQRTRAGEPMGTNRRLLGPFAAPNFVLFQKVWMDRQTVPAAPFVGLRWIMEGWQPPKADRAGHFVVRTLRHEELLP